jgi:hypothetical protein
LAEPAGSLADLARRLAPQCRTVGPGINAAAYAQLLENYLAPFRETLRT